MDGDYLTPLYPAAMAVVIMPKNCTTGFSNKIPHTAYMYGYAYPLSTKNANPSPLTGSNQAKRPVYIDSPQCLVLQTWETVPHGGIETGIVLLVIIHIRTSSTNTCRYQRNKKNGKETASIIEWQMSVS